MNEQLLCCDAWLGCLTVVYINTLYLTPNKGCFLCLFFQRYLADVVENFLRLSAFAQLGYYEYRTMLSIAGILCYVISLKRVQ